MLLDKHRSQLLDIRLFPFKFVVFLNGHFLEQCENLFPIHAAMFVPLYFLKYLCNVIRPLNKFQRLCRSNTRDTSKIIISSYKHAKHNQFVMVNAMGIKHIRKRNDFWLYLSILHFTSFLSFSFDGQIANNARASKQQTVKVLADDSVRILLSCHKSSLRFTFARCLNERQT